MEVESQALKRLYTSFDFNDMRPCFIQMIEMMDHILICSETTCQHHYGWCGETKRALIHFKDCKTEQCGFCVVTAHALLYATKYIHDLDIYLGSPYESCFRGAYEVQRGITVEETGLIIYRKTLYELIRLRVLYLSKRAYLSDVKRDRLIFWLSTTAPWWIFEMLKDLIGYSCKTLTVIDLMDTIKQLL